jgi:hypothetical protein
MIINPYIFGGFSNTYSLDFDGVDEYVGFTNVSPQNFALSAWIKTTGTNDCIICLKANNGTSNKSGPAMRVSSSGYLELRYAKTSTTVETNADATTLVNDGNWHHVAISKEGTALEFYVDGSNVASVTASTSTVRYGTSSVESRIGHRLNGQYFTGKIDEVAYWDDTDNTNVDLAAIGTGTPTDLSAISYPPIHWWRCGDGLDTISTIYDNIGSNDGTPQNMESGDIQTDVP